MKQDHTFGNLIRMIMGFLASILLLGCSSNHSLKVTQSNTALGTTNEPDVARIDAKKSTRTSIITSVEYQSQPWTFKSRRGDIEGLELTTPNYLIYTTKTTESFIDRLPLFYEAALANYTSAIAQLPDPPKRLKTYLFKNREQWIDKTREVLPEQANTFRNLGRGGFTTRGMAVLFYIDYWRSRRHHDTLAIAAHEGWHQYTQSTFKNNLPVWLEEGIAAYMEGFRERRDLTIFSPGDNYERRSALHDALRKAGGDPNNTPLIPLKTIITRTPQAFLQSGKSNLLTYYAQTWALVRFLAEGEDGLYRPGLEQVLHDAASGRMIPRLKSVAKSRGYSWRSTNSTMLIGRLVVDEYFNDDFDEFERQYHEFMIKLGTRRRSSR